MIFLYFLWLILVPSPSWAFLTDTAVHPEPTAPSLPRGCDGHRSGVWLHHLTGDGHHGQQRRLHGVLLEYALTERQ